MTKFKFDYVPERSGAEVVNRPKAEVFLCSVERDWKGFRVYIDSGADLSLFRRSDAELLGLKIADGKFRFMGGIGRTLLPAYVHKVKMRIGGVILNVKAAFVDSDEVPRLLGRADVFSHFKITFCERDLNVVFESI